METTKIFSIQRLFLMIKKDVFDNFLYVTIGYASIIFIFTFIFMVAMMQGIPIQNFDSFYTIGLTIVGVFIAGMAFNDFRVKEKSMNYLTLPASLFEKFLSMLILTSIGIALSFTVAFYAFNGLAYLIGTLLFDMETGFLNVFKPDILASVLKVFAVQSIFLAGAVTFKKGPLFLTLLALFVIGLVLLIYFWALQVSMVVDGLNGGFFNVSIGGAEEAMTKTSTIDMIKTGLRYCVAPLFWVITFLKLKEKEV